MADRPPDPQHRPAGAFVKDVGFALLFPTAGMALPSLYETACEQRHCCIGCDRRERRDCRHENPPPPACF
jgi:hypothetical protein